MAEPKNLGIAAAVAGGYLLGRGKKGQPALTAAALPAGRGLRPGPSAGDAERRRTWATWWTESAPADEAASCQGGDAGELTCPAHRYPA